MSAPEELVEATVASGHTLDHGEPVLDKDGKQVSVTTQTHGPGATLKLPASEVWRLRALGFLAMPQPATPPEAPRGPSITPKDGPSVKRRNAD